MLISGSGPAPPLPACLALIQWLCPWRVAGLAWVLYDVTRTHACV